MYDCYIHCNKVSETFSDRKVITLPVEDCRLPVESLCYYNEILRSENVSETLLL